MRNLYLLLPVCLLLGCSDSTSTTPLIAPCNYPVQLPERGLSDREIEIYWGRDRAELLSCGEKVKLLEKAGVPR